MHLGRISAHGDFVLNSMGLGHVRSLAEESWVEPMRPADERVDEQREDGEFEHYFQRTRENPLISQRSLAKAGAVELLADSPKARPWLALSTRR
jgi:hypothetical protein